MQLKRFLLLLAVASLALLHGAAAKSPVEAPAAAPPGPSCSDALVNLSSCLTYVEEGSNLTVPVKGCCPSLSSLVDNQPVCLCQLLGSGETFGIRIDTKKALTLPTACRIQTLPVSLCAVLGIPVASPLVPAPSPSSGGPELPGSSPTMGPSPNGSSRSLSFKVASVGILGIFVVSMF